MRVAEFSACSKTLRPTPMPSFDTVLEPNLVEVRNAVDQANKEIGTRFDFKGSSAKVELGDKSAKERELLLYGDSDFQLAAGARRAAGRLSKRSVDIRFLDLSAKPQKLGGDKLKQTVPVKSGIDAETGQEDPGPRSRPASSRCRRDPGRRGARHRRQARRPAGRDGAAAQGAWPTCR
jgi:hypothetical protein